MHVLYSSFSKFLIVIFFVVSFGVSSAVAQIANHIVISEVYGGGGNSGAQYKNDYVVLYNPTGSAVNITGWSIQYASGSGGNWSSKIDGPLSGMIASHSFFLIQGAAGTGTAASLPTPDADFSSTSPNFSVSGGTIALVTDTTHLSGDSLSIPAVVDYVGYGSAKYYQGTVVAALSNTTSAMRKARSTSTAASMEFGGADSLLGNGWDSGDNSEDFVIRYPSPQNSSSPPETPPVVLNSPPVISGIGRTVFIPSAGTADSVTASIVDIDGTVTGAVLHVRRNKGAWDSTVTMTHSGSTYVGIISAAKNASTGDLIEYFISAMDDSSAESSTAGTLQGYFAGNVKISTIKVNQLSTIVNYGVQVRGIINVRTNTFTNGQGYIQDSTGGLQMFVSGGLPDIAAGRNATIQGTLNNFQNAYELSTPSFKFVDTTGTSPLTPIAVTLPLSESATNTAEGKLIQIAGLMTDSVGIFSSPKDYIYKNGSNDTISVFVQSNGTLNGLVGKTIPAGSVTAKGILSFSGSSVSLKPRQATDMGVPAGDGTGTVTVSPALRFQNVSAVKETLVVTGDGSNTLSGCSVAVPSTWTWDGSSKNISGTGFNGAVSSVTGGGTSIDPYVITVTGASVTNTNSGIIIISNLTTPSALGLTTFAAKTEGTGGTLSVIASSPVVNIVNPYEAVASGNWSSPATWAGGIIPDSTSDATLTTLGVSVTIDGTSARCRNLTLTGNGTVANSGPLLQFASSGMSGLSAYGNLSISGGSGGGGGDRGGRPKLTSNGNSSAVLVIRGSINSSSSNSTANGNAGLNMNEGTAKLVGSTMDSLRNGATIRLANLEVGDGMTAKTLVWAPTNGTIMYIKSLRVKAGSTFLIGSGMNANPNDIGYAGSDSTIVKFDGGIFIEQNAVLAVQNYTSPNSATINLLGGGINDNGTFNLTTSGGGYYTLDIGVSGGAPANQTFSGTGITQFANIVIARVDTVVVQMKNAIISSPYTVTLNGGLVEKPGMVLSGTVVATRTIAQSTTETFGGIGFSMNAAGAVPGVTTITRTNTKSLSGNGKNSIFRYFNVVPAVNTGLDASIVFTYDTSEVSLAGQNESTLQLWHSPGDSSIWTVISSSLSTHQHTLTATGVNELEYVTASDVAHPLGSAGFTYYASANWNLISIPVTLTDYCKTALFPTACSKAFSYQGNGYVQKDTLRNMAGFWLKFQSPETITVDGLNRTTDTATVSDRWNIIGSISSAVARTSIIQNPGGIVKSNYFGYNGSAYGIADTLYPGKGYWVKTGGEGTLILTNQQGMEQKQSVVSPMEAIKDYNSLTVTDKAGSQQVLYFGEDVDGTIDSSFYDMPPLMPEVAFDVRFGSGRFVEHYSHFHGRESFPIVLRSAQYPVSIEWNIRSAGNRKLTLTGLGQTVQGRGHRTLTREVPSLGLFIGGQNSVPSSFFLSDNYPNPFNPTTKFEIDIPKTAIVEVAIFNVLGQKVRNIFSGEKEAGYYTFEWNGLTDDHIAAGGGIYFIRLTSEGFTATHKIALVK